MINPNNIFLVFLVVQLFLSGCTIVQLHGSPEIKKTYYPGFLSLKISPNEDLTYIDSNMLGFSLRNSNFVLGWSKEDIFIVGDKSSCSLIMIVEKTEDFDYIKNILKENDVNLDEVCIQKKEGFL